MIRKEKEKAIDALKISAPVIAVTQEEFNDYIKTLNQVMDWLEQEPKMGHWKMMYEPKNMVVCSECGKCAYLYNGRTSTWCPHCGNYKGE